MQVFDTNILIHVLQKNENAQRLLYTGEGIPRISTITVMELFHGIKGDEDEKKLRHLLEGCDAISVSEPIAELAGKLLREHIQGGKQQRHQEDVIIAATALHLGADLVTANPKDFEKIRGLKVIPFSL